MRNVKICKKKTPISFGVLMVLIFFATSCAKEGVHKPTGRQPQKPPQSTQAPKRTVNAPQRNASQALVEKALAEYRAGELDAAMSLLQDAITIDGQNGEAYYYAAKVCLDNANTTEAKGFLDKAEVLFADDDAWQEKIAQLRNSIEP